MISWEARFDPAIRPGLERIGRILDQLGRPQEGLPIVHVAGTNGKGSTAAMVAAALGAQGLKVGLTVSPDLGWLNERVLLGGVPISDQLLDDCMTQVSRAGEAIAVTPTFFEAMVGVALLAFRKSACEMAVVEVGLGGELDATNVVPPPLLSIITSIHYDHMQILGDRIEQIAMAKAGILKAGSRLVFAHQSFVEAEQVVLKRASALAVPVRRAMPVRQVGGAGVVYSSAGTPLATGLLGTYQVQNLATAWAAVEELSELGYLSSLDAAAVAIERVEWPGRFQVTSRCPLVVIDGAHNLQAAEALTETLDSADWKQRRWHLLFAGLNDKPAVSMVERLATKMRHVTVTRIASDRGVDPYELAASVGADCPVDVVVDPVQAYAKSLSRVEAGGPSSALLVTGCLAFLAELRRKKIIR